MTATTDIELKQLIEKLKDMPNDLDLINKVALGYFENPSLLNDKDDLKYFELAYNTLRTVKSSHNLAWYLYFEWGEQDRAIEIQKDCISLNPISYYPYYQYGFMLMEQENYKDAFEYLLIAKEKDNRRDILHNLGYCYHKLGDYTEARECFRLASNDYDYEFRSLYNCAILDNKLGDLKNTASIADRLFLTIEPKVHKTISGYEIGFLYYLLGDYIKSAECLLNQGINGIDLPDWKELSFSLYKTDKNKWIDQLKSIVRKRRNWIIEIQNNQKDWNFDSEEEKQERLTELESEIKVKNEMIINGISQPEINLDENIWIEPCGCLLFDCQRHKNLIDDK
jgi:tetratricopeptide (TPR) repeat protein